MPPLRHRVGRLRSVEDRPVWSADADRLAAIRSWLDGDGLTVCCLDTPAFKCAYAADPRAELAKLDRALHVAAALGAPMVRVFTRYDRLARNYSAAVAIVTYWI